jgi:hypothetical protein
MHKLLGQLDTWLGKAAEYAQKKPFDVNTLLVSRLAPDQFPLSRQIQIACDHAKFAPARLAGKESPSYPDDETTVEALQARIHKVRTFIDGFHASDFAGAEKRVIVMPRWEGKGLVAEDYLLEYAMPNFYFHLTHAYAILRHNGVDLGKKDYIGSMNLRAP